MFAGRVGGWERLQYRVRIENPTLSHEGARIIAMLLVPYGRGTNRVDYLRLLLDYMRYVDANGNPIYLLTYTIGLDATNYTDTIEVGLGTQELVVELVEPRWYTTFDFLGDPVWDVRWQDLRIHLNGVEIAHPFGGERSVLTVDYYPASMPMGAAELSATCEAGIPDLNDYDNCQDTYTVTSVATARVVGGYRTGRASARVRGRHDLERIHRAARFTDCAECVSRYCDMRMCFRRRLFLLLG